MIMMVQYVLQLKNILLRSYCNTLSILHISFPRYECTRQSPIIQKKHQRVFAFSLEARSAQCSRYYNCTDTALSRLWHFLLCCPYQKDMYCPVHDDSHESNIVLDYVISPFESEVTSFSLYWGELYLYSFILSQYNM